VVLWVVSNVLQERIASILTVETFHNDGDETSVTTYKTAWHYNPEDDSRHL
jgi:hypothetical protein